MMRKINLYTLQSNSRDTLAITMIERSMDIIYYLKVKKNESTTTQSLSNVVV